MKALTFLILCFASIVLADDFKTINGQEYKNVTVSRVEPDGIVITFSGGIVKIPFTELSPEIQKKYGYDPKASADFQQQTYEADAARTRQLAAAMEKRRQELEALSKSQPPPAPASAAPAKRQSVAASQNGSSIGRSGKLTENPTPAQGPRNCYVEVRDVLSGLEIQRNWETDWGSYDRDYFGRIILKIRLGTVGRTRGPMKIQWFWIGRPLIDINRLIIYGKGEKVVEVPGGYFAECYAAAPVLKNHTLNLAALGERYVSGAQHDGWIVCASDATDRVLAEKASTESLLNLFNNADRFSKLLSVK